MSRLCIVFLFLSSFYFSQTPPDSIVKFHNGRSASRYHFKTTDTVERVDYHKNGRIKDSVWLRIETLMAYRGDPEKPTDSVMVRNYIPFGTEKKYYESGKLSYVTYHGAGGLPTRVFEYRKKGSLSAYKENPYGLVLYYNRKGKVTRRADYNKKRFVSIPKESRKAGYLKQGGMEARIKQNHAELISGTKSVNIRSGSILEMRLTSDTSLLRHCLVEGFSGDSICISVFSYDLSESKNTLAYDTTLMVPMTKTNSIFYSKQNSRKAYRVATVLEVAGFSMVLGPLVGVPLFLGAPYYTNPAVLGVMVAGIPVFIYSKRLHRKMIPKEYKTNEWKIKS